ncbi:Phosphatidylcholine:ceramide cholinephosphotransferase 2 [Halotydeus destructor]|nr:Phosphatidylcholine:ceramide cholinephosphotransferase 2 [Halotydeus destructor]
MGSLDKKYSDQFDDITIQVDKNTSKVLRRNGEHSSTSLDQGGQDAETTYGHRYAEATFNLVSPAARESSQDSCCRTALAFLFLFYNMTLNLFILAVVHERVPMDIVKPLPDISFDALPNAGWALDIAEYIIVAQVTAILMLLLFHRFRTILFRRLCLIMGLLYLFRAICMISTVLPLANRNYYCSPQLFNSSDETSEKISTGEYTVIIFSRVFHMLLGFGLSINGRHNYCGDYLYSGHTVILTLAYLTLTEYLVPQRCRTLFWKFIKLLLFISSITGVMAILIARAHYLIDVLLAYYITTRIFWIYHTLAYNNSLRVASSTNYLSRVWWWYLFKYFECVPNDHKGAPCEPLTTGGPKGQTCNCETSTIQVLPRVFEWPFSRWARKRPNRCRQRLLPTPNV